MPVQICQKLANDGIRFDLICMFKPFSVIAFTFSLITPNSSTGKAGKFRGQLPPSADWQAENQVWCNSMWFVKVDEFEKVSSEYAHLLMQCFDFVEISRRTYCALLGHTKPFISCGVFICLMGLGILFRCEKWLPQQHFCIWDAWSDHTNFNIDRFQSGGTPLSTSF